jgi:hypothetical protein
MRRAFAVVFAAAASLPVVLAGLASCAHPLRMCTAASDCSGPSACVAGRCVSRGAQPAIATARREVFAPVALGYVADGRAGESDASRRGATPAVAALGRGERGGRVFLRFAVPLAPEVGVVEAYVLVDRVPSIDGADATVPVALHLAEVVDAWDPRSLSWASQPRIVESNAPVTNVVGSGGGEGAVVRLDARTLVERWRERRASDELGVALVAAGPGSVAVALAPREPLEPHRRLEANAESVDAVADPPRLELYLR